MIFFADDNLPLFYLLTMYSHPFETFIKWLKDESRPKGNQT